MCKAHRTPSISAARNYVYKHVYIYFLADGQARAVESIESGNLMVYGPLYSSFYERAPTGRASQWLVPAKSEG